MAQFFLKFLYIALLLLQGCLPKRPEVASPASLPKEALDLAMAEFQQENRLPTLDFWPEEEWWRIFNDDQLSYFIEKAIRDNPTIDKARLRLEKAILITERERTSLFPFVRWMGDIQRNKLSQTGVFPSAPILAPGFTPGPVTPQIPFYYSQFESSLNFEYDLDLFGKRKDQIAARCGDAMNAAYLCHLAERTIALSVAEAYFKYMGAEEERALSENIMKSWENSHRLITERLIANITSNETLLATEINLEKSRAELFMREKIASLWRHRLLSLIAGDFMDEIADFPLSQKELAEVPIPAVIPLNLLSHRLDVQAQIWLIESGYKRISAAEKRFYPDVNLFGFMGYQTLYLHRFFEWPSAYGNATGVISLPLFDSGLRQDELDLEGIETVLAIREYEALLLKATQEVLDSLSDILSLQKQENARKKMVLQANEYIELVQVRKDNDLSSEIDFLEKERGLLLARKEETATKVEMMQSLLTLVRALGGGGFS